MLFLFLLYHIFEPVAGIFFQNCLDQQGNSLYNFRTLPLKLKAAATTGEQGIHQDIRAGHCYPPVTNQRQPGELNKSLKFAPIRC